MTNVPSDPIDPYEQRLARRVGAYTEQAVQPVDAAAVARETAAAARGSGARGALLGRGRSPNLAWVLAAGALVIAAAGIVIGGGARGLIGPAATPTPAPAVAGRPCTPYDVDAVITAWDGAAGHRIATVELRQIGSSPCTVDPLPQPWLADGHGSPLISGKAGTGAQIEIAPGDVLRTLVQVGNYCGPAPAAPVTVAFTEEHAASGATFVATALSPTDVSGVPPCNGASGPTNDIQMHPWSR